MTHELLPIEWGEHDPKARAVILNMLNRMKPRLKAISKSYYDLAYSIEQEQDFFDFYFEIDMNDNAVEKPDGKYRVFTVSISSFDDLTFNLQVCEDGSDLCLAYVKGLRFSDWAKSLPFVFR